MLADRNVDDVQAELAANLQAAGARAHEADSRHSLANQSLAAAEERLEHALDAQRDASARALEERERLSAAIAGSRFTELAELEAALTREPAWLDEQMRLLEALKEDLTRREAALAERQGRLDAHETATVSGDLESSQAELSALESRYRQMVDDLAAMQGRLTADDAARRSDRKSTRLNSSHSQISYAVFCLKKKKKK